MTQIIDRRLNPKGKSLDNRQRFIKRVKGQIADQIQNDITDRKIGDISSGEGKVKIKSKSVSEPSFHNDRTSGKQKRVLPGNHEYEEGDSVPKPANSGGGKGNEASSGEGDDEFEFTLSREEFLDCLFDDLELPDFIKESLNSSVVTKPQRAGFTSSGSPANLNLVRTLKNSIGRRIALHRPTDEEIKELEDEIDALTQKGEIDLDLIEQLAALKARTRVVPYIDEYDLKYNLWDQKPAPQSQAVMFCLMDVSGSMGEKEKDIAKRFFLILYLFLERKYDKISLRFIRHTETAEEVDEKTFFYDRKSGGTAISSGLTLINDIINKEYPADEWNIYIAQCTDGDNFSSDNKVCDKIISEDLLPKVQYFAYIQVREFVRDSMWAAGYTAWPVYESLSKRFNNLVCKEIPNKGMIWSVFRKLFEKSESHV